MDGRWILAVIGIALLAFSGGALAQEHQWSDGDVEIVAVHPDLQFEDDGAVHSSGDFLAQIVLRGEDAQEVDEVAFSFGVGPPSPVYHPGYAGLWDYRVDAQGEDGWFIPITTEADTPDGDYKFAAHAYSSAGDPSSEIARHWGAAVVDNAGGDDVGPWPAILPGETGQAANPHGVQGVTIEFAENASAELFVDGQPVALEPWTPPARDNDDVPRHTEEASVLGDGYQWQGEVREGTVLRVEATDEAGNAITKGALVGHGIDNPVLEARLADVGIPEPGEDVTVPVEVANVGLVAAEPAANGIAPAEWNATVSLRGGAVAPGETTDGTLSFSVPEDAAPEIASVGVELVYSVGDEELDSRFAQRLGEAAGTAGEEQAGVPDADEAEGELAPGTDAEGEQDAIPTGAGLAVVGLLLAGSVAHRRPRPR